MAIPHRIAAVLAGITVLAVLAPAAHARSTLVPAHVERSRTLDLYQQFIDESAMPTPPIEVPVALVRDEAVTLRGRGGRWYIKIDDLAYLLDDYGPGDDWLAARLLFMHEMGHIFDMSTTWRAHRPRYERIMYDPGDRAPELWNIDLIIGVKSAEMFADSFAFCAVFPGGIPRRITRKVWWGYGASIPETPSQHARICRLIRNTAKMNGWA